MTTIRVRTQARKVVLKARPGVRVRIARPAVPVKSRGARIRQVMRVSKDHD